MPASSHADSQLRNRPLAETLAIARSAAVRAGVTRLGDVTGLAPFGLPVFQAVRPRALSLSVSQGKGLTPTAAKVSALLEAVELATAERLPLAASEQPSRALPDQHRAMWCEASRPSLAIRLDPDRVRPWVAARDLISGRSLPLPWELLSLDFTRAAAPDVHRTSAGLATGNTPAEAAAGAVAEVLEHDLQARLRHLPAAARQACQLDLTSVDDPLARALIARVTGGGFLLRAWSCGQEAGVAVLRCAIMDAPGASRPLPPSGGSACHPDRTIAFARALLEAVQSRITLVAGARDDLTAGLYARADERTRVLLAGCDAEGRLDWGKIPHRPVRSPEEALDQLLEVAQALTSLPVLLYTHEPLHPALVTVHAVAPGLEKLDRERSPAPLTSAPVITIRERRCQPVLFVGPSLPAAEVPAGITVRAPAVCGDLSDLLADPPAAVGLIDGCFEIAPTVWHKEIVELLAHGIPVLGGASLGAIRAAELHAEGMVGIGRIFEAYRDGTIVRDDAVMLCHGPRAIGYPAVSVALVDAEAALAQAAMPAADRRQLLRIVRTTPFAERTWSACLATFAARTGHLPSVTAAMLERIASPKREDARSLAAALLRVSDRQSPCAPPPMTRAYAVMRANRSRARR